MEAVREHSFEALRQAKATMSTMVTRAQQAQEDSHLRVMMYQLAANEYVPVLAPLDVVAKLREEVRPQPKGRHRGLRSPRRTPLCPYPARDLYSPGALDGRVAHSALRDPRGAPRLELQPLRLATAP